MPYIKRLNQISNWLFLIHRNFWSDNFQRDCHYIQLDKSTLNIPLSQIHPIFPNHELVRLKTCSESILAEQGSRDQVLPHVRHMLHIRQSDLTSRCHLQNHIAASFDLGDYSVPHPELLLSLAFLIGVKHRPIGANVGGCTRVIPPFLGVVAFNHVGFSHHSIEILLREICMSLLILDLFATLNSLVLHFVAVVTFPFELLHIRIDLNTFVLEVFSRSLQGCNSFGRLGRRISVCLSFAFVLSHVDIVLLSSDLFSSSVSGFHLKPHDELLEPHLLLLVLQVVLEICIAWRKILNEAESCECLADGHSFSSNFMANELKRFHLIHDGF
ncbi:hypothetical protein YC2023_018476 [Brassica napus]